MNRQIDALSRALALAEQWDAEGHEHADDLLNALSPWLMPQVEAADPQWPDHRPATVTDPPDVGCGQCADCEHGMGCDA